MDVTVRIGEVEWSFDPDKVNGLDAWECWSALAVDVLDVLAELGRFAEGGNPPPFHLAVVARWLSMRQQGSPLIRLADVAAVTTVGGARGVE